MGGHGATPGGSRLINMLRIVHKIRCCCAPVFMTSLEMHRKRCVAALFICRTESMPRLTGDCKRAWATKHVVASVTVAAMHQSANCAVLGSSKIRGVVLDGTGSDVGCESSIMSSSSWLNKSLNAKPSSSDACPVSTGTDDVPLRTCQ
jgi:hypothetical protein